MTNVDITVMQESLAFYDSWISYKTKQLQLPGLQYAVFAEGSILQQNSLGYANLANKEKLTNQHVFRVASQSKMVTAVAIMQLHESQKLDIERPITHWLPLLPKSFGDVTIRNLLSHGSGIIRDAVGFSYWDQTSPFPSTDQLFSALGDNPNTYNAGENYKYSNIGYALLGLVVESASGLSFGEYVEQFIFNKLDMKCTSADFNDKCQKLTEGYTSSQTPEVPPIPIEPVTTAGGLAPAVGVISNALDMCKLVSGVFEGNKILLSEQSKTQMRKPIWEIPGTPFSYGLGGYVANLDGHQLYGHGGLWLGHESFTLYDSEEKLCISAMTNTMNVPIRALITGFFKVLDFAKTHSSTEDNTHLDRFCGRFGTYWGPFDIVRFGKKLFCVDPSQTNPVDLPAEFEVIDNQTLQMSKAYGNSAHGENFVFNFEGGCTTISRDTGTVMYPYDVFIQQLTKTSYIPAISRKANAVNK